MRKLIYCLVALLTVNPVWSQVQNCSIWNSYHNLGILMSNLNEHSYSPGHAFQTTFSGGCFYSGVFPGSPCSVQCSDDGRSYMETSENASSVSNIFYYHKINTSAVTGTASSNGGSVSCGSTVAVAATSCLKLVSCTATIHPRITTGTSREARTS